MKDRSPRRWRQVAPPSSPGDLITDGTFEEAPTSDLAATVRSGTRLLAVSQATLQGVRIIVALILARLLSPHDFGLVAMAFVVIHFLDIFKDLGTKAAVVQRREFSREFASSIFVANLVIGGGLTLLVLVTAPLVGTIYGDVEVVPVLRVLGLVIAVSSLGLVHQAYLHREMRFGRLAVVHFATALATAIVSLALAVSGWGVWSLVLGTLAGSITANLLVWSFAGLGLTRHFSWAHIAEIRGFSLNLTVSQLFGFGVHNLDKFILGRWLGPGPLGHYNIAQRILMYPVRSVTQVLQEVLFPAMSRIQDDDEALGRGYVRALSGIALVTFPAMVGVAVVADPFVRGVLGPQWVPAIPVIVLIAPIGALQSLLQTVPLVYTVKGRTDLLLRFTIWAGVLIMLSYVAGLPGGIVGVASAYAIAHVVLFYPAFAIPFRLIGLPFSVLLRALRPIATASVGMAAVVLALRHVLYAADVAPVPVLAVSIAAGTIVYGSIVCLRQPAGLQELIGLLRVRKRAPVSS